MTISRIRGPNHPDQLDASDRAGSSATTDLPAVLLLSPRSAEILDVAARQLHSSRMGMPCSGDDAAFASSSKSSSGASPHWRRGREERVNRTGTPRAMKELMQLQQLRVELSAFSSSNSGSSGISSGSWSSGSSCGESVAQLDCEEL
jgi:hypothetical protein